jgi:predicted DNA-binding WGR domain protein
LRADILPLLKTAHGPVALKDPDVMLYFIDPGKNSSKFYEMKIVKSGLMNYVLQKRWGRLTDSGVTGRVDSKDEMFDNMGDAQRAMQIHAKSKMVKGYKPAPNQEYPIGLGAAGFGWGGQAACSYTPELKALHARVRNITSELEEFSRITSALARRQSGMAEKLTDHIVAVKKPVMALDAYLEHQLSSCL